MKFEKIRSEIKSQYKKEKDQKIAERCLQLGEEWARIESADFSNLGVFAAASGVNAKAHKKALRSECKKFIRDSLDPKEIKAFFPAWVLPFIVQVILSTVISWIVRRMIDDLLDEEK